MITLLIILLIVGFFQKAKASEAEQAGPVTYLEYSESGMRHRFEYKFKQEDDGTCFLSRKEGWSDEEGKKIQVDPAVGEKLLKLVKKHKMLKYKSSYTPSMRVLDGITWHLEIGFEKGERLYTGGENASPDGGKGIKELEKYLDSIWATFPQELEFLEYSEDRNLMYPVNFFRLKRDFETGSYTLLNASSCDPEKARSIEIPKSVADQISQIIVEENMLAYQREYKSEYAVLDGATWNLRIRFINCRSSVYASGHEAWPEGDGIKRILRLCQDTWKKHEKKAVPTPLKD